jgi:hypothetical protein
MRIVDPATLGALAALITSIAALITSFRRSR